MGRPKPASKKRAQNAPRADSASVTTPDVTMIVFALCFLAVAALTIQPVVRELVPEWAWANGCAIVPIVFYRPRINLLSVAVLGAMIVYTLTPLGYLKKYPLGSMVCLYLFVYIPLCIFLNQCRQQIENK